MGTIVGVELETARRACLSVGIDPTITDDLLSACERGAVAAMNEKQEDESQ